MKKNKYKAINLKDEVHSILKFQATVTGDTIAGIVEKAIFDNMPDKIIKQYAETIGISDDSELLKFIDKEGNKLANKENNSNRIENTSLKSSNKSDTKDEIKYNKNEENEESEENEVIDEEMACYL